MKKKNLLTLLVSLSIFQVALINVANAKSDYIYEKTIDGIDTITICDTSDSSACITMMDKNLGATTNDITSYHSYGYHFQWGNNHGFLPGKVNTQNHVEFPNGESIGTSQIDCSPYGPGNPLNNNVFIKGENDYFNSEFDYCDEHNYNLWGGGNDYYENNRQYDTETHLINNAIERQGPCPKGYHIPSNGEWQTLLDLWTKNYGQGINLFGATLVKQINANNNGSDLFLAAKAQFLEDFKIPLAGSRSRYDAYLGGIGQTATYWSSSPYIGYDNVHFFSVGINSIAAGAIAPFANAYSIRCFKDTSLNPKFSESNGNYTTTDDNHPINNTTIANKDSTIKNKYNECIYGIDGIIINKNRLINYLKCIHLKSNNI